MDVKEINRRVVAQFRAGGLVDGMRREGLLLLTTTGRRSGAPHVTPMMFHPDGPRLLVIASNIGAPRHPEWYLNLVADPAVTVEIGDEVGDAGYRAVAAPLRGAERGAAWAEITRLYPFFVDHQAGTGREIPIVALSRAGR